MVTANLFTSEDSLLQFCQSNRSIYLYGAGEFGGIYLEYLNLHNIHNIEGFLVSKKTVDEYNGIPVYEAEEYLPQIGYDSGIILSLSCKYHNDILKSLEFPCQVGYFDDGMVNVISCNPILDKLDHYQKKLIHPKKNEVVDGNKILVVQVEHTFGDVIWSTGLLRELRKNFPHSYIGIVLNSNMKSLFQYCPYVDEIVGFDLIRDVSDKFVEGYCEKIMDFCTENDLSYDVVYLPRLLPWHRYELWENLFIAVGCGANKRVAHITTHTDYMKIIARKYERFFTEIVKHDKGEHEALRNLMLLSNFHGKVEQYEMELWIGENEIAYSKSVLNYRNVNGILYIAIGLVGSNPARSWSPEKYNRLFKNLANKYPCIIFVLCGGKDAVEAAQKSKEGIESNCIDLTGKTTLLQVAAVISRCDFYIGSDTGVMHMASAFGKPVIELSYSLPDSPATFGSHPVRTGPWCVFGIVLRPSHGLDGCKYICRRKQAHCINLIAVNEVIDAVELILKNRLRNHSEGGL